MVEQFNDRYRKMFLHKKIMNTAEELHAGSLAFETPSQQPIPF